MGFRNPLKCRPLLSSLAEILLTCKQPLPNTLVAVIAGYEVNLAQLHAAAWPGAGAGNAPSPGPVLPQESAQSPFSPFACPSD